MIFLPTVKQFLSKAMIPVGHTMYIYGGGWNREDTAAGIEARSIGESSLWESFFSQCDENYNFNDYKFCTKLGLDCTGYIGWTLYNLFNSENGNEGYVFSSAKLGESLRDLGLGAITDSANITDYKCGDIFYSASAHHAYICIGMCSDGSVLLVHASPPGVMLSGTPDKNGDFGSMAQRCANEFMEKNFPQWHIKFPCSDRGKDYMECYNRFRFYQVVVPDMDELAQMPPQKVLSMIKKH